MARSWAGDRCQMVLHVLVALVWAPAVQAQAVADIDSVRIAVSGQLDVDTRVVRGPLPGRSGMLLRRATLTFDVSGPGGWVLRIQPDFSQGRAGLLDAYLAWRRDIWLARVGRQAPSYGVEKDLPSTSLVFPEYGVVNSLMTGRLFGVQINAATPRASFTMGGYVPAGIQEALVDVERDPQGPPQLGPHGVVRATWRPLAMPADPSAPPSIELQVAGGYGYYRATDPALPGLPRHLTPAQRPALSYRVGGTDGPAATVLSDGPRFAGSIGAQAVIGALHLIVEGAEMAHHVRLDGQAGSDRERLTHAAWQVRGGWLIGGRRSASFAVVPNGRDGAWEFGARAGGVRFDRDAIQFAAEDAAARAMVSGGLALAWVPRQHTRLATSVDVTRLTGPTSGTERALVVRVQQAF